MMNVIVLIPARMGSTRFPGKVLAPIEGKPMIQRVYEWVKRGTQAPVVVACAEKEVQECVQSLGGQTVMTDPELPSGSDRIAAAVEILDPQQHYDVVVNVQGDLPEAPPNLITDVLRPFEDERVDLSTLAAPLVGKEIGNPNNVKVVWTKSPGRSWGPAHYFSRSPIPHGAVESWHHMGIYAYRRAALRRFVEAPPSPLEKAEKLEQLRAIELGLFVALQPTEYVPQEVNVSEDVAKLHL